MTPLSSARKAVMGLALLITGVIATIVLLGAQADPGLPQDYWHQPLSAQGAAPGNWPKLWKDLQPEACAQCHQAQYEAWKTSLHAHAFSPGLVGQFPGLGMEESNSCLNCHAPLAEQKLQKTADINKALVVLNKSGTSRHSKGLPLRHAGVSCASCHVRGWQRHGPPPRASGRTGHIKTPVHGGFLATRAFERSQFCAACHQFPQEYAINGKPLENTVFEWQQSRFAREGIHCQQCHMPERKHEFRGIHDASMTKRGLKMSVHRTDAGGEMIIRSVWVGHAFPTYVTPRVVITARALDKKGRQVRAWRWEIVREVVHDGRWREIRDTRLMPGEMRTFSARPVPESAASLVFQIHVEPDHFYKGVYRSLLASELAPAARRSIKTALEHAVNNDYLLYEESLDLS